MGRAIFISYRRDDSEGEAGRLFDDLTRAFGEDAVFMDVDGITPGMDFRKAIDENVSECGVLLAMIGPTWATIANTSGGRRLDDANDFVRLEIASALGRNIALIPVLVHEGRMPHADQLPDDIKDLAYRNSVEITHARWNSDVQLLIKALERYVSPAGATDHQPVHATVPVQLPPPAASPQPSTPARGFPRIGVIAVAVVLMLGAGGWLAWRAVHQTPQAATNPTVPAASPAPSEPAPAASASVANPPAPNPGQNPPAAEAQTGDFSGTWVNPVTGRNNGIARLQISGSGSHLNVHGWGWCAPMECDWNTKGGDVSDGQLTATFLLNTRGGASESPDRTVVVEMRRDGDRLHVHTINHEQPNKNFQREFEFTRAQ